MKNRKIVKIIAAVALIAVIVGVGVTVFEHSRFDTVHVEGNSVRCHFTVKSYSIRGDMTELNTVNSGTIMVPTASCFFYKNGCGYVSASSCGENTHICPYCGVGYKPYAEDQQ